jgi:PAS domain S-box-containing protein
MDKSLNGNFSTVYQAILESMGEGIIFSDANDCLAIINQKAEEIRGIKAENFIGRDIISVHPPNTAERIGKLMAGLRDGTIKNSRRVIEVKGKYFENSYYPIRQPDGVYLGTLLVSRDITEKQRLKDENRLLREQMGLGSAFEGFVGTSQSILQVFRTISAVASFETTILITGESGTGKELVAAAIHQHSLRRNGPMVRVNCAALPEHLVESELFGHVRGAFTGAVAAHRGKFEQADGGTIFLDEVGDLPPAAQAKLLRVLQEKTVVRIGAERESSVNVRIIAATNKNLRQLVASGVFREDLYYRLNVIVINVPALRERRDDILPLAEYFISKYTKKMGRQLLGLSEAAISVLVSYDYPGNVRELEHAIERAVALCGGDTLTPEGLPDCFLAARTSQVSAADIEFPQNRNARPLSSSIVDFERQVILDALSRTGGHKADAARLLNISRKTLWQKLKQIDNV